MTKKEIEIGLLNGATWKTEAEVIGDLAVHPSRTEGNKFFSVTHLPTTMSMNKVVPKDLRTNKSKLVLWVKKVQNAKKVAKDWVAMRSLTKADVLTDPEASKLVRERIRAHCLSVKE